ncbi:MAG: aldo/keto reductase [Propionibacteriaceae bacterium]|nr:aldo/keto reductase [Propionibacteriaceae bacterium]
MTYAHLGRSGLLVGRIGLGTMNFSFTVDEPSSFSVMDAAIDAGINFFRHRRCLRRAAAAVAAHEEGVRHRGGDRRPVATASGHRDDIVVATKVCTSCSQPFPMRLRNI